VKQEILNFYKQEISWTQLYQKFPDIPRETIRGVVRRSPQYLEKHQHQNITYEPKQKIDINNFFDILIDYQKEVKKFDNAITSVAYPFLTDYMCIIDWGDWHFGATSTNYERLKEDLDLVLKTPNIYGVINGDMINNYIELSPRGGGFEEISTPKIAKEFVKKLIQDLQGKILAVVSGDHDNWSFLTDDFKPAEYFAHHGKTAFLDWGGDIILQNDKVRYKITARHRARYNSALNPTNAHRRIWEEKGDTDIVMLAHTHRNFVSYETVPGQDRLKIFLNAGTYKEFDNYGKKLGYDISSFLYPAVVLNGNKKEAFVFRDFREAIEFMENKY
jgi:predicted phosphodiesterase